MAKKRSDGRYQKVFTYNGKKYCVYGKNQAEIFEKQSAKIKELELSELNYYNPKLREYYEEFTKIRRREIRESTIRAQRCQFDNISETVMPTKTKFGDMRIKDITRRDIEKCRELLLEAGKTPQNLNICFAHLNHVFNNAVLDDTITKNPCKALKPLRRDTELIGENKHRALSIEETKKFFEVATERNSYYLNIFMMMIKTGMRVGEVTALYPFDIDKTKGFIHVKRSIIRDEIGAYIVGDNAKTKSGERDIPLTSDVLEIIKNQKTLNAKLFEKDGGLLFRSVEGEILREYTINREIKRICEKAGIDYFTCHAFRNTFATRFIEQRPQDYKILSEILGHKDVSITLNLYTHVMVDNKVNAMNELKIAVI